MFSFQPAAFVGDDRRWHEGYRDSTADDVWAQIEQGAGARLPFRALQIGDERCNRTSYGFYVGARFFPAFDDEDPADLRLRDTFFKRFGGVSFSGTEVPVLAVKVAARRRPSPGDGVALRSAGPDGGCARSGQATWSGTACARSRSSCTRSWTPPMSSPPGRPCSAARSAPTPASATRRNGCWPARTPWPTRRPDELVPACVQHSVLDPVENVALRRLLPLTPVERRSQPGRRVNGAACLTRRPAGCSRPCWTRRAHAWPTPAYHRWP